jgi:uncharacterized protein (TIGR02145 family)
VIYVLLIQYNYSTLSKEFCMTLRNPLRRTLFLAAAVGMAFAISAQGATAYVPFVANTKATIRAEIETVSATGLNTTVWEQLTVWPDEVDTLVLPLQKVTGVIYSVKRNTHSPATLRINGGKITINLPAQSYGNAEISLYSVNGKRLMHHNINAASAVNNITLGNIATGAYLLAVRGPDGSALTTSRLTHSGGGLNINVTQVNETHSPTPQQAKSTADIDKEVWTIKITAAGHEDSTYTLTLGNGINPRQVITLRRPYSIKIGPQTWMAANLDIKTDSSWCGNNVDTNCAKYGRMYNWTAAKKACPSGWHLPSLQEWQKLLESVGDSAGTKLKATYGWGRDYKKGGTDNYGFSALPGGVRESKEDNPNYGTVFGETSYDNWWTSTQYDGTVIVGKPEENAYSFEIREDRNDVRQGASHKRANYRVRCIQN